MSRNQGKELSMRKVREIFEILNDRHNRDLTIITA